VGECLGGWSHWVDGTHPLFEFRCGCGVWGVSVSDWVWGVSVSDWVWGVSVSDWVWGVSVSDLDVGVSE
jgi:hypothetical protein